MLHHYIKIAFRNLLKYKLQSFICIVGLAIGFTSFALSSLWIRYELTYDTFRKDADRIYYVRMESETDDQGLSSVTPYPLARYLKETFPEIEESCNTSAWKTDFLYNEKKYESFDMVMDSAAEHMFEIELISGSRDFMIPKSNKIAITDKLAKEVFGTKDPLGEKLKAFDKYRHNSSEAGAKYILTALFSSALLLFGLSMIYGSAGTLYFDDLPAHIDGNPLQIMAFVFFFTGMAFKLSLVPFHLWTADVYEGAPSTVTAYLSVISKGSAAFVLLAILIKVFAPMIDDWQEVLYWVTIASITIANIFAIRQQNLKRLMAFSSISQAGYIMLGVIGGTAQGMTALVYYVLVYAVANLGVFAVITIVALRSQKFTLEDYAGLYKTNPKIALLMTLSLFSLAGIPPFAGFFSKFFIFMAAFDAGFHLLVFIALVNTVISLYYYLLIVKAMYITPSDNPIPTFRSDRCTKWGLALCTLGIIGLGIASIVYQSIDKFSFGI